MMRGVDSLGGGLIAWIGRRGLAHFWEGRDQRSWSISEAWASYAWHGYARWTGISSLDWVAVDRCNTGGRGISAVGLFRRRGQRMRGMDMLDGLGLVPWIGWLEIVAIWEGMGSAQLVYFGGVGIVCAA